MTLQILYFSWIRERIGKDGETVTVPDNVQTIAQVADYLCEQGDEYRLALENRDGIKVARNQSFAAWDEKIGENDELAFFPPVTGG